MEKREMKISQKAQRAIFIGLMCAVSYLAVYIARNILGAVTPQMVESGYSEAYIGTVSSTYFVLYATGQLINGALGDKIKAKYMICFGLLLAGVCNIVFSRLGNYPNMAIVVYGMTGFFLAMIYGPMMKIVAENTEPIYATRCSLGFTFASFLGSPMAGVLAAALAWQSAFTVSSALLACMSVIAFCAFTLFERKGLVKYNQYKRVKEKGGSVKILFKHRIVKFTFIAFLTGIVRTSVVFWMPTYISQYLGFSSSKAASIYTVATFIISLTTFIAVFIYERLKRNMDVTILLMFSMASVFFSLLFICKQPVLNIVLMVLAVMSSGGAAAMLYSRYCPSLRDTGMVSTATGFLDCVSYIGAAIANVVFANAVGAIGWANLILIWCGLMVCGVLLSLPYAAMFKRKKTAVVTETPSENAQAEETEKLEETVEEVACEQTENE